MTKPLLSVRIGKVGVRVFSNWLFNIAAFHSQFLLWGAQCHCEKLLWDYQV